MNKGIAMAIPFMGVHGDEKEMCALVFCYFFGVYFLVKKIVLLFVFMMLGELKSGGVTLVEISCWLCKGKEGSFCNREAKYGIIFFLLV
jgi:hypothetical protein